MAGKLGGMSNESQLPEIRFDAASLYQEEVFTDRIAGTIRRLNSMAVPPAYREVRYSPDPASHLQAVGLDAAGRLQYRYHADWEKVREQRKAHRLARLVAALPKIRRNVSMHLSGEEPTREFALSAVIELIARTAIRPWRSRKRSANCLTRPSRRLPKSLCSKAGWSRRFRLNRWRRKWASSSATRTN